jgi:hypothetical protein
LVSLLLVALGFVLVLAPTYLRNHNVSGGYWVLSTKAPWNFWKDNNNLKLVNHDWRQPTVRVHAWLKAYYELGSAAQASALLSGVHYDESNPIVRPPCDGLLDEMGSCERRNAIAYILEDPVRFLKRAIHKNASLWSPNNYIFNRAPPGHVAWNQNFRVELPTFIRYGLQMWVMFLYLAVMLAFFLGITAKPTNERQRYAAAFVSLCLLFLVFVVVSAGHGITRFRLPFMLPISMFAVLGFARARALLDDVETST